MRFQRCWRPNAAETCQPNLVSAVSCGCGRWHDGWPSRRVPAGSVQEQQPGNRGSPNVGSPPVHHGWAGLGARGLDPTGGEWGCPGLRPRSVPSHQTTSTAPCDLHHFFRRVADAVQLHRLIARPCRTILAVVVGGSELSHLFFS
jgi:hypothetical protein